MKTLLRSPLLILVTLATACNVKLSGSSDEVRSLGGFASVTNRSDAKVVLKQDKDGDGLSAGDVEIVCDAGIVADVDTIVDSDGNLVIQFAAEVASVLGCEVWVVSDGVIDVVNDGDGDIVCDDPLLEIVSIDVKGNGSVNLASVEADVLNIGVTGTGALDIGDVEVTTLNIDLGGTGDATLAGNAVSATLAISGSGSLLARDLTVSDTLDAVLDGTGDAVITVLGTVNAEVHGGATLEVYGGGLPGDISEVDGGVVTFY